MKAKTVLISGAGVAGPTLAYWLARAGFRPTVVERAAGLRSSGSPVDVRGPAAEVARKMGLLPRLRAAATGVTGLKFVNDRGKRVGRVKLGSAGGEDVELSRTELARILYEASRDEAEFAFHDSVKTLEQDEGGVEVTFEKGAPRRFDLVVGADGLHSAVRELAFGAEAAFVKHMGVYVATLPLDGPVADPHEVVMYNSPGRAVAVHPGHGRGIAAFMYRGKAVPDFDHRDTAQHRRMLAAAYTGAGWRVPELLEQVRQADDLYLDSVSRVRLPAWSAGRIALAGDAASCVSLFGDGSTLAMAGAHTLATALAESPGDHATAFRRYEATHRKLTGPKQRNVPVAAALLIPATRAGMTVRNLGTRFVPLVTAAQRK
ncbi:FAD-dependent monooxygenase [Amycolatopsis saalfeldensis]|uniref:2-polyprenyl-6-methoxyphenol hydroxylase n=1 Tax=Amycolatopsis saalfeldensis TaxID=394193 RepID=A0A1H8Y5K1_9PSEU|nr:FAD-dependent monooxygenase [Amycolatopsis saalfeldensis]SEP47356.1 2-polyprenyl-6-methoxyphenol hydroxylase [Amycolatopsis saalfeldensis]